MSKDDTSTQVNAESEYDIKPIHIKEKIDVIGIQKLVSRETNIVIATTQHERGFMLIEIQKANAKHLAKCWNCHDDLLDACKKAQKYINFILPADIEDRQIPYEVLVPLGQAINKAESVT